MKPWTTVGRTTTPDGGWLELREHDGQYFIMADGLTLMVSTVHGSEEDLASLVCNNLPAHARVLVGGLGMGYTLRAALDKLPANGEAVVAELLPEVIAWNRGPLGPLAGQPLDDSRVTVEQGDVARVIKAGHNSYDAILLDVDNGPNDTFQRQNWWLYSPMGLAAVRKALRPGGRLSVWSANDHPEFPIQLTTAGFISTRHRIHSHGTRAFVFVGQKGGQAPKAQPIRGASR